MKKYKIFAVDENNRIEFTREELESLLDETYNEGFSDGKLAVQATLIRYPINDPSSTGNNPLNPSITWTGPTDFIYTSDSNSTTCTTETTTRKGSNL